MKTIGKIYGVAALLLAWSAPALAHPHVFIESWSDVIFNDEGKIIGLYVEWQFDQGYSQAAIEGLDANGDGEYSSAEIDVLGRENIKALGEYSYFVYARADGKQVGYETVTEFNQVLSGKQLKLVFRIPFKTAIDPKSQQFSYKMYDPSFYIAIDYAKETPVNAIGEMPPSCRIELGQIAADEQTENTRKLLEQKGPEWQPEQEEDFGALFAQPVRVICNPRAAAKQ